MKSSTSRTFVLFGTLGCTLAAYACSATPAGGGSSTGAGVGGNGSQGVGGGNGYVANAGNGNVGPGTVARQLDGSLLLAGTIRDFHATFPDMEPCTNQPNVKLCDSGHVEQNSTPSDTSVNCGAGTAYPNNCFIGTTLGDDSKPVYVGPPSGTASTTGPENFARWFNTAAASEDINQEMDVSFILADNGNGTFTYNNPAYFPIDDQLFGNEGNAHNFGFTTEFHMKFTYRSGQTFYFKGDDDLVVFINKQLVVDRSGIHNAQDATLNLDNLGLNPNQSYQFDLFYCERHKNQSDLLITTSMEFTESVPIN